VRKPKHFPFTATIEIFVVEQVALPETISLQEKLVQVDELIQDETSVPFPVQESVENRVAFATLFVH
jgi:hypothetical protein